MTAMHLCPNMGTRRTQGGDRLTVGMRSDRPNSPITGLKGSPPRVLQGVKWASEGCLKPQIWVLSLALHPNGGITTIAFKNYSKRSQRLSRSIHMQRPMGICSHFSSASSYQRLPYHRFKGTIFTIPTCLLVDISMSMITSLRVQSPARGPINDNM